MQKVTIEGTKVEGGERVVGKGLPTTTPRQVSRKRGGRHAITLKQKKVEVSGRRTKRPLQKDSPEKRASRIAPESKIGDVKHERNAINTKKKRKKKGLL